jgi:hypothetical protein
MKETIEEAAKSKAFEFKVDYKPFEIDLDYKKYAEHGFIKGFKEGAKWMEERMYSEEDMLKCWNACERFERPKSEGYAPNFNQFIENLKKSYERNIRRSS